MNARERKSEAGDALRAGQPNGSYAIGGTSEIQGTALPRPILRRVSVAAETSPWLEREWKTRGTARSTSRSAGLFRRGAKESQAGVVSLRPSRLTARKGPGILPMRQATASNEAVENSGAGLHLPHR